MTLVDLLAAGSGTVCAVGAGGKKTTLYHLAAHHPGRVALTCTVPHAHFPPELDAEIVIAEEDEIVDAVTSAADAHPRVAFACPSDKPGRHGGLAPELIRRIAELAGFDLVLVKGDGARMRWIKAPDSDEPRIPSGATTVIPLVSAHAIGEVLTQRVAHRVERLAAVSGARAGEPIAPVHVARLLTHPQGALKHTGTAAVVPVINMVDNAEREALARAAARAALDITDRFDRVVLTCSREPDRLVDVVYR